MNLSYGLAKTGGTWAFDTDLGIQTDFQSNSTAVAKTPAKGEIATINTIVTGSGYTLNPGGLPKEGILCSATNGTGSGAIFQVSSIASAGNLVTGASVVNTAGFNNYQNALLLAHDPNDTDPYTYAKVTSSGASFSGTSLVPLVGTSATGSTATFTVTVSGGSVTSVIIATAGSGYLVGDVVTITEATLEANPSFGGGIKFQGDLKLLLTEDAVNTVSGGINTGVETITVVNGGSGYVVGDVLTLQEVGSSQTGTAQVTVATLGIANTVITAPNNRYPRAVRVTEGTIAAPKTIEFVGMNDVNVIIGGFLAGSIFPMNFKQIVDAGSDVTLGDTTILY